MLKKKVMSLALVLFLLAGTVIVLDSQAHAFFGFGDDDDEDKALTLWHTEFVTEWPGRADVIDYFEKNNDLNVKKDYGPANYRDIAQKMAIQANTGDPDVVEGVLGQMFSYQKAGLIMPLDKYFKDYEAKDTYLKNALDALTVDGKLYGIPYNTNVRLLLYRKSIFEEHNLDVPKNWDELVQTAAKINKLESNMQGFMFTTKSREVRAFQEFMSFYLQLNRNMFDVSDSGVELVATEDQLAQVLNLYKDMFFEGGINLDERGADWKALDYGYTSGKYAMVTVGPWIWGHRNGNQDRAEILDDTGIAAVPVAKNGKPGTYMEVKPIMINKYSDQPDKAWELLKTVTSKGMQTTIDSKRGVLSPRKDVMNSEAMDNWWLSGFAEHMDTGVALDPISWERQQNVIIKAIQRTIYKEESPEEAADWLHGKLAEIANTL